MRGLFTNESFHLGAGEVLAGRTRRPRILHIVRGSAWVTIEGVHEDYWLSAGDALPVATGRLIVVEAQAAGLQMHTGSETLGGGSFPGRAWKSLRALLAWPRARRTPAVASAGCCAC